MKRLYHFLPAKYAFDDLCNHRLKIARLADLNDPFEHRPFNVCDPSHREAIEGSGRLEGYKATISRRFGVLCFSERNDDLLMWAHYADRHRGICLGFDVDCEETFGDVLYEEELIFLREDFDQAAMWRALRTKAKTWAYEKEWRVFTTLKDGTWDQSSGQRLFYSDFGPGLLLREVILGARNCNTASDVYDALGEKPSDVRVAKMHLSCRRFELEYREINLYSGFASST